MHGLLKTLMRPDREEDPERTLVAQAANILQVGEFQVLQLAYHEWYGQDLPEALSDRLFEGYMLRGAVPHWAREYALRIVRQDEIDLIDSGDPAYHRYDQNYVTQVPRGVQQFTVACLILASVFVVSLAVGQIAGVEATSILPPFFQESELNRGP
jgi:hypothetical protein